MSTVRSRQGASNKSSRSGNTPVVSTMVRHIRAIMIRFSTCFGLMPQCHPFGQCRQICQKGGCPKHCILLFSCRFGASTRSHLSLMTGTIPDKAAGREFKNFLSSTLGYTSCSGKVCRAWEEATLPNFHKIHEASHTCMGCQRAANLVCIPGATDAFSLFTMSQEYSKSLHSEGRRVCIQPRQSR